MSVLVLSSSPRKGGNSDLLCDQFVLGAHEVGHRAEKIFLSLRKINYCTGCGTCFEGAKRCPQKDDMPEVLEKMIAADVIAMATLIDRTCPGYTRISAKEFSFIMTAADTHKKALERTLEGFRGFTSCLTGAEEKGVIYGTGAWQAGEIKGSKAMSQAYEMGRKL